MNKHWTLDDISDLTGKNFVVTGGNAGLGYKSVAVLANTGANVVLTSRNAEKGKQLAEALNRSLGREAVTSVQLDLTEQHSIKQCADAVLAQFDALHGLINNAGVVNLASLTRTPDGREMHMATNHFGHFALTGHLFSLLTATAHSRVVTLSSGGYRAGVIDFDDINWHQRPYSRVKAYGDSKLANLLFMRVLQTKFDRAGATSLSVAAHPGLTATERQQTIGIGGRLSKCLATPVSKGVAPQLFAATERSVDKCDFYGPRFGIWGSPKKQNLKGLALDQALALKLWQFSEEVTGVSY